MGKSHAAARAGLPPARGGFTRSYKPLWQLLRRTVIECDRHETIRLGASLAFYAVLSLAPLVILAIALAGSIVGMQAARDELLLQFQDLLGTVGASAVRDMIGHAQSLQPTSRGLGARPADAVIRRLADLLRAAIGTQQDLGS